MEPVVRGNPRLGKDREVGVESDRRGTVPYRTGEDGKKSRNVLTVRENGVTETCIMKEMNYARKERRNHPFKESGKVKVVVKVSLRKGSGNPV